MSSLLPVEPPPHIIKRGVVQSGAPGGLLHVDLGSRIPGTPPRLLKGEPMSKPRVIHAFPRKFVANVLST